VASAFDALDVGYFSVDGKGRITEFNRKAEELTGLAKGEVVGQTCAQVFADWACREACPLRDRRPGEAEPALPCELTFRRADGRVAAARKSVRRLTDSAGRVIGLAETLIEQNLSLAEANTLLILDSLAVGVFAVDAKRRITYYNRAAEQLCGVAREQAIGQKCRDVFKSSLCDSACPLQRATETREQQDNIEAVFVRQDGRSVLPVKVSTAPIIGPDGLVQGGVETFRSIHLAKILDDSSRGRYNWEDFVGASRQVARIFEVLKVVAHNPVTILIEGPTGTGKGLLSSIIHHHSPRRGRPFIKVNCAALPESLLESEMFGYVRGAFTGADRDKPGLFQLADGGTIFLDEISEMPLALQAKLLRVLEDRKFYPLGGRREVEVDVRVLAASNRSLAGQIEQGLFREDLFYRLNVIRIYIPPLKERREDVPLLINRIIQKKNIARGTFICRFSEDALKILLNYNYPGNVREMENILEHACLLCQGDIINAEHLPNYLRDPSVLPPAPDADSPVKAEPSERDRILSALRRHHWNRQKAARELKIDRTTLWRWMKRHRIEAA